MTLKIFLPLILAMSFSSCISQKNLKLMTYNIRLDVESDGENAWTNRKGFLSSQVLFLEPDILGVQEAKPNQINDLDSMLIDYDNVGLGRNGGSEDEHSSIYYNSRKLEVKEWNTFWLSETPGEVSKGWDAAFPRICTYALFSTKKGDEKFWVFNTHLDHRGKEAQKEGMKVILEKIKVVNTGGFPVMLMGDFNVEPDSEVIQETKDLMLDTRDIAVLKFGPEGTFNGFKYDKPVTRRIDYILISKVGNLEVKKYAVLSSNIDFKYPSDHFPVYVELEIK